MAIQDWANAIASIESAGSGGYSAIGPKTKKGNRAYGRYQVMDFNVGPWTQKHLGRTMTPEEFLANPQAQDAVFNAEFGSYVNRYGNPQDAASVWFTGRPLAQGANASDVLGTTGAGYVNKFNRALGAPQQIASDAMKAIGKGAGMATTSTQQAPRGLLAMDQEPEGLGIVGGLLQKAGLNVTREGLDRASLAMMALSGAPMLQPLMASVSDRMQQSRQNKADMQKTNKTIEWLMSIGRQDLAEAVAAGALTGGAAAGAAMQKPEADIRVVDGNIVRVNQDGTVDTLHSSQKPASPQSAIAKLQADLNSGLITQDQFDIALQNMAPPGFTFETGPDGQVRFTQGKTGAQKPFTEAQSKDVVFATRADGALAALEPVVDTLISPIQRAAGADPTGVIRGAVQTPEFQQAENAANEFLQAILRKDTGAAITAQEQALYGKTYLPQPGDGPEVLAYKKAARARAVAAIKAGMSPEQMLATENALLTDGQKPPETSAPPAATTRKRYNPEKDALE